MAEKCNVIVIIDDTPAEHCLLDNAIKDSLLSADLYSFFDPEMARLGLNDMCEMGVRPGVILHDLNMLGKISYNSIWDIRAIFNDVVIIAFSTTCNDEEYRLALENGATISVQKPLAYEDLLTFVTGVLTPAMDLTHSIAGLAATASRTGGGAG